MTRLVPPNPTAAPVTAAGEDGSTFPLAPMAARLCERYFTAYPDDGERLGSVGWLWCEHDSRHLLAWGLQDARTHDLDCVERVAWLARVLAARGFPLERLACHVGWTAEVLTSSGLGPLGARAGERMDAAARALGQPGVDREV